MPSKGVYRDSIGKCDMYSNPYDTRMQSHPAIVKNRADKFLHSKDSLASPQWKLEKDIFLKIQSKEFAAGSGKWKILVLIGKYAFLAAVLPPYIFCYGIPKWLLTSLLPKLYDLSTKIIRGVSDKATNLALQTVQGIQSFATKITSPILLYIQTRIENARELFASIKENFIYLTGYPMRLLDKTLFQPFSKFLNGARSLAESVGSNIEKTQEIYQNVRQFLVDLSHNLFENGQALTNFINARFASAFEPYAPALQSIKDKVSQITESLNNAASFLSERLIHSPLEKLSTFSGLIKEQATQIYESIAEPITAWMDPKMESIRRGLDLVKERYSRIRDRAKQKVKETTSDWWESITDRTENSVKVVQETAILLGHMCFQIMPTPLMNLFRFNTVAKKANASFKRTKKMAYAVVTKVLEKFHSGMQKTFHLLKKGKKQLRKIARKTLRALKSGMVKGLRFLKILRQFLTIAMKGTFLIFVFLLAWLSALVHYGMVQAQNLTREYLFPKKSST